MKFDKLVRDKIPQILQEKNLEPTFYICDNKEYITRLKDKLKEEVNEFLNDETIEELADILEVVYALSKYKGTTKEALEIIRNKKAKKRGAFDQHIVLLEAKKGKTKP